MALMYVHTYAPLQTKVQKDLLQHGVQLEAFAGDVQSVEISALKVSGWVSEWASGWVSG